MAEILINFDDALIQFTAVGGETGFAYDFPIFDKTHLVVLRQTTATADPVTMSEGTGYTVAGVGDEAGGSITFVTPASATLDEVYTLFRDVPEQRITDFTQAGSFTAVNINRELDLMAMQLQQLRRDADRSARMDQFDPGAPADMLLPVKADRASLFAAWDAAGKWIAATAVTGTPVTAFMKTVLDDTAPAAARKTLNARPAFHVFDFDAIWDGVADDTVAIQTGIEAVEAAGGGELICPVGTGIISAALVNDGASTGAGVVLVGAAPVFAQRLKDVHGTFGATRIRFDSGAAPDNMIKFIPVEGASNPNLQGAGVKNIVLDANETATRCLFIKSNLGSIFHNIACLEATVANIETGVVLTLLESRDIQHCDFDTIFCINSTVAAANAHCMDLGWSGVTGIGPDGRRANTSLNSLNNLHLLHDDGDGLRLAQADGNYFGFVRARLADPVGGGTGVGVRLMGNDFTGGSGAIQNTFMRVECEDSGLRAETGSVSNSSNRIFDYSSNNAAPEPVVIEGARLHWFRRTIEGATVTLSANQSIPDVTTTSLSWGTVITDTGPAGNKFNDVGGSNPSRLVIPTTRGHAFARIVGGIRWASNSTGRRQITIHKNGTSFIGSATQNKGANGEDHASVITPWIAVTAGDYFEVRVFQSSTAALNALNSQETFMEIEVRQDSLQ